MGKQPKRNVRRRKKQVIFRLTIGGLVSTGGTVYPNAMRVFNWDAIFNLQTGHNKMFYIYCIISPYMI